MKDTGINDLSISESIHLYITSTSIRSGIRLLIRRLERISRSWNILLIVNNDNRLNYLVSRANI